MVIPGPKISASNSKSVLPGKTIVRVNISDAVKRADAIMNKMNSHLSPERLKL